MQVVFLFYLVPSSRRLLSTTARRLKGEESRRVPDLSNFVSLTCKQTDQTPSLDASTVQLILCSADEHVHVDSRAGEYKSRTSWNTRHQKFRLVSTQVG